jgi:hypothetical protein
MANKSSLYGDVISSPIVSLNGGWDTRIPQNTAPNTFNDAFNLSVTTQGLATFRPGLKKWLPDTVDTVYQMFPVLYAGAMYYFVCDDGVVKYCQDGATSWTTCGGSPNSVTRNVRYQFIEAENKLYIANGNDLSRYIDLTTMDMVTFVTVIDPTSAPTLAAFGSGLTFSSTAGPSTPYPIYYSVNYNGAIGQTANSPIVTGWVSIDRVDWVGNNSYGLTVTFPTAPTGATSVNLWLATAATTGSITNDDMLMIAAGLPIANLTFADNGSLQPILNGGTAPDDNSTEGFVATYGTAIDGRVFLWGIVGQEYTLIIGGDPGNAFDLTPTNGGFQLIMNEGTNYYPTNLVSFRNNQSEPAWTMLYSSTQGVSKQAVIASQTVTYGDLSFVDWTMTDQGRSVPAASSPYAGFVYNNSLFFPTATTIEELTTKPTNFYVLSVTNIAIPITSVYQSIAASQLPNIVGCGIDDKMYFSCAVNGFDYNNIILVYDYTDPQNPRWYPWNIRQNWVGVVSPPNQDFFLYVSQDNHIFRLEQGIVAQDEDSNGVPTPFDFGATGPVSGLNPDHSSYLAIVQALFYVLDVIGEIDVTITYAMASPSGILKYKSRTKAIEGPDYIVGTDGNWTDYQYQFLPSEMPLLAWGGNPVFNQADTQQPAQSYRQPVPVNEVVNEMQWQFASNSQNSGGPVSAIFRGVSYEGVSIGPKGDIQ